MTIITAPSMHDTVYQGPLGNASVAEGAVALKSAAVNDVIHLLSFPAGLRVHGLQVINTALGTNVKGTFHIGKQSLIDKRSLGNASAGYIPVTPCTTVEDDVLTMKVEEAAVSTAGTLNVIVHYRVTGTY